MRWNTIKKNWFQRFAIYKGRKKLEFSFDDYFILSNNDSALNVASLSRCFCIVYACFLFGEMVMLTYHKTDLIFWINLREIGKEEIVEKFAKILFICVRARSR